MFRSLEAPFARLLGVSGQSSAKHTCIWNHKCESSSYAAIVCLAKKLFEVIIIVNGWPPLVPRWMGSTKSLKDN